MDRLRMCGAGLAGLMILAGHSLGAETAQAEAVTPAPARDTPDSVLAAVTHAMDILKTYQLPYSPKEARRNTVEALFRSSDPNAQILNKEGALQLEKATLGRYFDAGMRISMSNGMARVASVAEGSSAQEVGLHAGDVIQTIDETLIMNMGVIDVSKMLRRQDVGVIAVTVKREGDAQPLDFEVPLVERQLSAISEVRELPANLCYLRLNGIYKNCGEEVAGRLRSWADAGKFGVVLDLRQAGGDDLKSVEHIANLVSEPNSLLFSLRDIENEEVDAVMSTAGSALGMPMLVLIDGQTGRAAEVLAATLSGSGKGAILVGESTLGDPEIRDRVRLAENEWVYVATRRLVTADGTTYRGDEGVQPHMRVSSDSSNYQEYVPERPLLTDPRETTDEELEDKRLKEAIRGDAVLIRAVDVLLGLKALNIRGYGYVQGVGS